MRLKWISLLALVVLIVVAPPVSSQGVPQDDGQPAATGQGGAPTGGSFPSDGELTTLFANDNGFAGNMFDLEALGGPLTIVGWDVNLQFPGSVNHVQVFYREGGSVGFEEDPMAWTFLGEDTNVISAGDDNPSPVAVGGLQLQPGTVYGIYIHLESYEPGVSRLVYTNGGPTVYANADLQLTTNVGKGHPAYTGGTFASRQWNGTVYYNFGGVPTMPWQALVLLLSVLVIVGMLIARRTRRASI